MTLMKRKRAVGDAMSVVTRFVNACNRHDADAVYSCLHPDFDSIQPMFPTRNFRGADQVRRNWQAIFDAEPGFRLTVLRSAAVDDTVWLELHGAGEDAEVAGVFVMGIQGDRIRWARIYSGLVEPVPATAGAPAQAAAPPQGQPAAAGNGEVVEEELIAPVVDIERSGRRRRRGLRRHGDGDETEAVATEAVAAEAVAAEAVAAEAVAAEPEPEPEPEPQPAVAPEPDSEPVVTEMIGAGESDTHMPVDPEPEAEPADVTVAHDMLSEFETEPEEEPAPGAPAPAPDDGDDHPKWRFGKKR